MIFFIVLPKRHSYNFFSRNLKGRRNTFFGREIPCNIMDIDIGYTTSKSPSPGNKTLSYKLLDLFIEISKYALWGRVLYCTFQVRPKT